MHMYLLSAESTSSNSNIEFWGIVLGAALATLGGIISFLLTNFIQRHNKKKDENRDKKIELYTNMLAFLQTVKFVNSFQGEMPFAELSHIAAQAALYASTDVKKAYDDVMGTITKLFERKAKTVEWEEAMATVNAYIEVLAAKMKKEIKIEDKHSKKLLQLINSKK